MNLHETIKDMPIFSRFTDEEKRYFAERKHTIIKFREKEKIIVQDSTENSLYLLLEGSVFITKDEYETPISRLEPGAVFGEISFFTRKPRRTNAIAGQNVTILKMDETFFKNIEPGLRVKIKDYLIELLVSRLDAMNDSLARLSKMIRGKVRI